MIIIPAIDILQGRCVRLYQGDYSMAEVYDKDPVTVAREYEQLGATRIHIVDLDAARGNRQVNLKKIRKIRKAVSCQIQLGGGIRSDNDIERLLDFGIDRLVIGTVFARSPGLVEGWTAHYGEIFITSIDARNGTVYVEGWEQETRNSDLELARRAGKLRSSAIIYTSIIQDGTLEGPDIDRTNKVAEVATAPVILSGGIGNTADIEALQERGHENIIGVILGKAIFEGKIDLTKIFELYHRHPVDSL